MKLNRFFEALHITSHIENPDISIVERSIAKFKPLIIFFLLFLTLHPSILFSQEVFKQKEGYGYVYWEDVRSAREKAIKNALQEIVIDTVQEIVESMIFNKDRKILEERYSFNPAEYIKEYRILSEDMVEDAFIKVSLEALVDKNLLKNDLAAIGIPLGLIPLQRILIMIGEKRGKEGLLAFWWRYDKGPLFNLTSLTLSTELTEAGFDIIDPFTPSYKSSVSDPALVRYRLQKEEIQKWGYIYGADMVISGDTNLELLGAMLGSSEALYRVSTYARIIEVSSGEEIFSRFVQKGFISDRKDILKLEKYLRDFTREVANGIIVKLIDFWKEKEEVTLSIELLLRGVISYDHYIDFKRALLNMKDRVISIKEKRFSRGDVLMDVEIKGSPFFFKEELQVLELEGVSLMLSFFSRERIDLTIMPEQQELK